MEERGFTVGPNNRVVPAILRGMPQQAAFALMNQVAPVMEMLTAPQNQVCTRHVAPCACVLSDRHSGILKHSLVGLLRNELCGLSIAERM
jgi:hypothetical protein